MDSYKKIIALQWIAIILLLIFMVYLLNKNSEIDDEISSLSYQIEELQGPSEAYDVHDQISDLQKTMAEHSENLQDHQDEISSLSSRLNDTESNVEENRDKLDNLCLIKSICI